MTTSIKHRYKQVCEANFIKKTLQIPYVERNNASLKDLFNKNNASEVIIVMKKKWTYQQRDGRTFFFHPNLSTLRVNQLRNGSTDSLISVAEIKTGDMVLDCTMGMGADSIVSSFVVGRTGGVVALESQKIIAHLVGHGLQTYTTGENHVDEAMRAIKVINEDYMIYLEQAANKSFDVILFDPMFRNTVYTSSAMQDLKLLANPSPVNSNCIENAKRVARKKIVLKERSNSTEFERLGFKVQKKTSSYAIGVIDVRDITNG